VLGVLVSYFFDEMPASAGVRSPGRLRLADPKPSSLKPDPMATPETLELVGAYYRIVDLDVRKHLFDLIKALD
jgi:hypothetical protein